MRRLIFGLLLLCTSSALGQTTTQPATTQPAEGSTLTAEDPAGRARYRMETSRGVIILELDATKAPTTALNFHGYASSGYYNGTIFHRVIPTFMIQGGGYTVELDPKTAGLQPPIRNEWNNGLKNARGTIAMARRGRNPNSATSQFFINVVDNPRLDRPQADGAAYAVFGKVVEGDEVVEAIRNSETRVDPKLPMGKVVPVDPVVIQSVTLIGAFDWSPVKELIATAEAAERQAREALLAQQGAERQDFVTRTEEKTGKKFQGTESGLQFLVLEDGTGETPAPGATVEIHYVGYFLDGTKFDSSYDRGQTFKFGTDRGAIAGMLEGVKLMKVGGKHKLLIPSALGYGKAGRRPVIEPDTDLVFDVELVSVKQPKVE